ncbi:MAG: hypothetical protein ABEH64_12345 [Salinirussus sp.]
MAHERSRGRVHRRNILKTTGVAATIGLAGCGGGDDGDTGGDTGTNGGDTGDGDGGTGGGGETPTEMGPPEEVQAYIDELPDYYPDEYWRVVDGAMDEGSLGIYTAYFGAFIEQVVGKFQETIDFIEPNITTLGTAEVFSRFTTEASRGQINPDTIFTYDPIAMRQLYTANLLEGYASPEEDNFANRAKSDITGLINGGGHTLDNHAWNPSLFEDAGKTPPKRMEELTDAIEDDPEWWKNNTCAGVFRRVI